MYSLLFSSLSSIGYGPTHASCVIRDLSAFEALEVIWSLEEVEGLIWSHLELRQALEVHKSSFQAIWSHLEHLEQVSSILKTFGAFVHHLSL